MIFNDFYSKSSHYFSNNHSGGMQECLEKYKVAPCLAIDIGAGEGRNSLYLASQGFSVLAIEPSSVGAMKIKEQAKQHDLEIDKKSEFNTFKSKSCCLACSFIFIAPTELGSIAKTEKP